MIRNEAGWLPQAEPWMDDALCAQVDPETFFPEKGGSVVEPKSVCSGCEVRERCLAYALEHDVRFGIWGGKSVKERDALKRAGKLPSRVPPESALAINRAVFKSLYAQGLLDTEVAVSMGCTAWTVGRLRRSLGLPSNHGRKLSGRDQSKRKEA